MDPIGTIHVPLNLTWFSNLWSIFSTAHVIIKWSKGASFGHPKNPNHGFSGATDAGGTAALTNIANIDIGTQTGAEAAIAVIDGAIDQVNNIRSDLGAISNRLDKTINNLSNIVENTSASRSHINDADFAAETSALTKAQILNQAATSMLAQANASKQNILALLQNG